MCKTMGIILLVFSSVYFIYIQVNEQKKKICNLKEMRRAITYLKQELFFSGAELSCLCEKTAKRTRGDVSQIFGCVAEYLNKENNTEFYTAWQKAKGEKEIFSQLTEETLAELFSELGKKSLDIEIENIERTQQMLEQNEKDEEEKYRQDRKLICTLGASFCAMIVIIAI